MHNLLINKVNHASSLEEDLGWALTSAREVADVEWHSSLILGKEWGQVGQPGLPGFCVHL